MLILGLTGSALAAGINHSGQTGLGAHGQPTLPSPPGNNPDAGVYYAWKKSPTLGAGTNGTVAGDNSPHGNFTTTTVKCVVCHAVHYAAAGGAPVGVGQTADTLLRMKASEACIFCHATAGQAVNGRPVYDGLGSVALDGPGLTGGATNTGHIIETNCTCCHTNVHGANADHSVASLDGYLLKLMPTDNVQGSGLHSATMLDNITYIDSNAVSQHFLTGQALAGTPDLYRTDPSDTLREQAVGVFCAECHNGAYATGVAGAATNVLGSGTVAYTGHRIAALATPDWNADHSKSSGLVTDTAVAYAPAANCKACHDASDVYGNKAFPHSWGQTKMWLTSAPYAGTTTNDNLLYGTALNSAFDAGSPQLSDGVCLKCHVDTGGTTGVGITF
jgi:hypothetical protein